MGPNGVPETRAKIVSEKIQFLLILHKICSKTNRVTSFFFTKLTRKKIGNKKIYLGGFLDLLHI